MMPMTMMTPQPMPIQASGPMPFFGGWGAPGGGGDWTVIRGPPFCVATWLPCDANGCRDDTTHSRNARREGLGPPSALALAEPAGGPRMETWGQVAGFTWLPAAGSASGGGCLLLCWFQDLD